MDLNRALSHLGQAQVCFATAQRKKKGCSYWKPYVWFHLLWMAYYSP